MPARINIIKLALMSAAVLCISAPSAFAEKAQPKSKPAQKQPQSKSNAQSELSRIQEKLKGVRKKEKEAVKQEQSVLFELKKINKSLASKKAEVKNIESKLGQVNKEIGSTQFELQAYRNKIKEREHDLGTRLRAMYKTEHAGGPWVLLFSGGYGDMLRRYKYLSVISQQDKKAMDSYEQDIAILGRQNEKLQKQLESIDNLRKARDREAARVKQEEQQKKAILASIRKKKSLYNSMARDLEAAGRRMQGLIQRLEVEKKAVTAKPLPKSVQTLKAGLDWPVSGKVIGFFGRQRHPDYDVYITKKGIEIEAPRGAGVRAVESAVVAFANQVSGMGLVAVLQHGGGYYTVYAHLGELKVGMGDKVARGQVIADLGEPEDSENRSLYFEVRKGSDALDPLKWLKKK